MEFNELIADFATRHGVENLDIEDGATALDIDGIIVCILSKEGTLTFSADIGEPPVDGTATFADLLLEANLQSDAFFAKDGATGVYVIERHLALQSINGEAFDAAIEAFVNQVETWRQFLIDFRPAAKAAAEHAEAGSPSFGSTGFIQV